MGVYASECTAAADAARRENGLAMPFRPSIRGAVPRARSRNSSSTWEPASCADRPTARDSAERFARMIRRPVEYLDVA